MSVMARRGFMSQCLMWSCKRNVMAFQVRPSWSTSCQVSPNSVALFDSSDDMGFHASFHNARVSAWEPCFFTHSRQPRLEGAGFRFAQESCCPDAASNTTYNMQYMYIYIYILPRIYNMQYTCICIWHKNMQCRVHETCTYRAWRPRLEEAAGNPEAPRRPNQGPDVQPSRDLLCSENLRQRVVV